MVKVTGQDSDKYVNHRVTAIILLIMLIAAGAIVTQHNLSWTDETRVAGIALQMADRQLYSVPYLGTEPFVEKPPLYHTSAAVPLAFIDHDTDPTPWLRLVSLLWGLLTTVVCFHFTAGLAKRTELGEKSPEFVHASSWAAVIILLTMPGFVSNALTVRVDIALACWYLLALFCAYQWVITLRPSYLYGCAFAAAMAFLSKGLIGPALIGVSALALLPEVVAKGLGHWREHGKHYALAIGLFIAPLLIWLAMLYLHGGKELLSTWFIDNQVARFNGGGQLGHEEPGQYAYYFRSVYQYLAIWVAIYFCWLGWCGLAMLRRRPVPRSDQLLLLFFMLPLLLLSIATTKRPVYMLPLLPLCASAIALFLCRFAHSVPLMRLSRILSLLCISLVVVFGLLSFQPLSLSLPLLEPFTDESTSVRAQLFIVIGLGVGFLVYKSHSSWQSLALAMSLILLLAATVYYPAINEKDSQHHNLQTFLSQLNDSHLDTTAGYHLGEGLDGYLYVYLRRGFEPLSRHEVKAVLSGNDRRFRCVLRAAPPLKPSTQYSYSVIATIAENDRVNDLHMLCRTEQPTAATS